MRKQDAIHFFGSRTKLAEALGVDVSAISHMPTVLSKKKRREVIGAAIELGYSWINIKQFVQLKRCANEEPMHNAS